MLASLLRNVRITAVAAGLVAMGAALAASDRPAAAQEWPERPIQIIVGYGAGGGTDRGTRITGRYLEQILGVPVTVQNMPGAGSQVATMAMLREPADGYTVLATNQPDLLMTDILNDAPYSPEDFSIVAVDVYDPRLLIVPKDSPYQSFDEFVKAARANPGELSISVAAGAAQDVFARWLMNVLDLDVRIVGYPSGGAGATAMLGGHVTANMGDDYSRLNMREQTNALLLGSAEKSPRWPEAELMMDALKRYGVEVPSPDFLARYHVYVVPSEFEEKYPERFKQLQDAFVAVGDLPEYKKLVAELEYEDLALLVPGEEYEEKFSRTAEVLKEMADELK